MPLSKRVCCIKGCFNTPSHTINGNSPVKFYSFPKNSPHTPWKVNKRIKWINAVKNYVKNSKNLKDWEPSSSTKICSAHFINNEKSEHPLHPSYVPSIFPGKIDTRKSKQSLERFKRQQRRYNLVNNKKNKNAKDEKSISEIEDCQITEIDMADHTPNTTTRSISCQSDKLINNDANEPTYFFCNLIQSNNGNGVAEVQVNLPVKKTADKMCNVNLPILSRDVQDCGCDPIDRNLRPLTCTGFHGFSSVPNEKELSSLTGVNFSIFYFLLSILPHTRSSRISQETLLLLVLMKLKTGLSYTSLGVLFNIDRTSVQRKFRGTVQQLRVLLKNAIFWPSKLDVQATLPEAFKLHYPETRVIIDCTEVNTELPPKIKERVLMYSDYKHHHTFKFLVGCTPNGCISFLSKCYGGRASDSFITNDCGIIDLIEPGDVVLADKGFPSIKTEIEGKNAIMILPPFLQDQQFTPEEVEETYNIASVRIHIERINQRIKEFRILSKIPVSLFTEVDNIVYVICALVNLENPIIKQQLQSN